MKKILSIFLSLLMLLSSMGFTLSTHFCGGYAMESAFTVGEKHLNCGMMDMEKSCANHDDGKSQEIKTACCSNEFTAYDIQDDFSPKASFSLDHTFLVALVYTYAFSQLNESDTYSSLICYSPPPLDPDIPVLNQSFLL